MHVLFSERRRFFLRFAFSGREGEKGRMSGVLKRKVSCDFDFDACAALPKRYRLDPELPIFQTDDSCVASSEEMPHFQEDMECSYIIPQKSVEIKEIDSEEDSKDVNEERALVLYRPVTPPMFPGGPPIGSPDLPIKFHTSFMEDNKAWTPHGNFLDVFRLMNPRDNQLAVVPWVPSQFQNSVHKSSTQQIATVDEANFNQNETETPMDDDGDTAMMDADPVPHPNSNSSCIVSANEKGTPNGLQWQHFILSQTSLNPSAMWSY